MDIDEPVNNPNPPGDPIPLGGAESTPGGTDTPRAASTGSGGTEPPGSADRAGTAEPRPDVSDREIEDFAYGPDPDDPFVDDRRQQRPPPPPGARRGPPRGSRVGPTPPRRLYRHPKGQLGGVAQGLAHYFAIDVALIRFLLVLSIMTAVTPCIYIAAWIAIPKAPVWPPPGPTSPPSLRSLIDSRTVRTGGIIVVGLLLLGAIPGGMNNLVIAAALVGAGLWMLNQQDEDEEEDPDPAPAYGDPIAPPPPADWWDEPGEYRPQGPPHAEAWDRPTYAYETTAPGPPPPPRNWRPLKWLGGIAALAALIPIGVLGILFAGASDQAFDGPVGEYFYAPTNLAELQSSYGIAAGEMTLDLSNIDFRGETRRLDLHGGVGKMLVVVPPNIAVETLANTRMGHVDMGRLTNDHFDEAGRLIINASMEAGEITIMTGHCTSPFGESSTPVRESVSQAPTNNIEDGMSVDLRFDGGASVGITRNDVLDDQDVEEFDEFAEWAEDFDRSHTLECQGG